MTNSDSSAPQEREQVSFLVFSASLRADSLNSRLARLAATTIEATGGIVDSTSMPDFDTPVVRRRCAGHGRFPARRRPTPGMHPDQRRLRDQLPRIQRLDAGIAEEHDRLGISVQLAALQRDGAPRTSRTTFGLSTPSRTSRATRASNSSVRPWRDRPRRRHEMTRAHASSAISAGRAELRSSGLASAR
jgi:hypothetical protein